MYFFNQWVFNVYRVFEDIYLFLDMIMRFFDSDRSSLGEAIFEVIRVLMFRIFFIVWQIILRFCQEIVQIFLFFILIFFGVKRFFCFGWRCRVISGLFVWGGFELRFSASFFLVLFLDGFIFGVLVLQKVFFV